MARHLSKIATFLLAAPFLMAGYIVGAAWISFYCGFKWADFVLTDSDA